MTHGRDQPVSAGPLERTLLATAAVAAPLAALGASGLALSMGDLLPCGFRWLTGLPCPLCGGTHAVSLLLHADPVSAVQANAGVTALAVLALSACGLLLLEALTARRWLAPEQRQTLARRALTGCAAILALNWVAALGR